MFSDQFQTKPDEKGQYFIDRDPVLFHYIIKYLRNVSIDPDWCKLNKENLLEEFKDEIEFYQIHSLRDKIELRLKPLEILEYSHLFDIEFRGRRTALVSRPVDGKGTGGILIGRSDFLHIVPLCELEWFTIVRISIAAQECHAVENMYATAVMNTGMRKTRNVGIETLPVTNGKRAMSSNSNTRMTR
jgi:hypothetical protein